MALDRRAHWMLAQYGERLWKWRVNRLELPQLDLQMSGQLRQRCLQRIVTDRMAGWKGANRLMLA